MSAPTKDLSTLFADVCGSTGLYRKHGDQAALTAIDGCIEVLRHVTGEFGGRIVKTIGDEVMAVFPVADDAFQAACEMQWRVCDLPPIGNDSLAIRVAFHHGPTLEQGDDVFGDSVNVAARLAELAKAGQIITSGRTVASLCRANTAYTRKLAGVNLRGMDTEETIFEAIWRDGDNITTLISGIVPNVNSHTRLVLRYKDQVVDAGAHCPVVTFGRDPTNSIVIASRKASRIHARIEWRRDKFFLVDQSTNGTYVTNDRGTVTAVRLEEISLTGRGLCGVGHPAPGADGLLEYNCEQVA